MMEGDSGKLWSGINDVITVIVLFLAAMFFRVICWAIDLFRLAVHVQ